MKQKGVSGRGKPPLTDGLLARLRRLWDLA